MKKIKFLSRSLLIVNILFATLLVVQIIILVIPDLMNLRTVEDRFFGAFHHLVIVLQSTLLLLGLWNVQLALTQIIRSSLYNLTTQNKSRKGGTLIILFGLVSIGLNLLRMSEINLNDLVYNVIQDVFTCLVGVGLLVLSEFVKNGIVLKEDVDLTI